MIVWNLGAIALEISSVTEGLEFTRVMTTILHLLYPILHTILFSSKHTIITKRNSNESIEDMAPTFHYNSLVEENSWIVGP